MLLMPFYAKECLTREEFKDLYDTVLHESMHSTDGWQQRLRDWAYELVTRDLSPNHQSIYNRTDIEMGRLLAPPEEIEPNLPIWGRPFQPNRPIVAPLLDGLYDSTRPVGCEC